MVSMILFIILIFAYSLKFPFVSALWPALLRGRAEQSVAVAVPPAAWSGWGRLMNILSILKCVICSSHKMKGLIGWKYSSGWWTVNTGFTLSKMLFYVIVKKLFEIFFSAGPSNLVLGRVVWRGTEQHPGPGGFHALERQPAATTNLFLPKLCGDYILYLSFIRSHHLPKY